jgi:Heparinase II/III-like protein
MTTPSLISRSGPSTGRSLDAAFVDQAALSRARARLGHDAPTLASQVSPDPVLAALRASTARAIALSPASLPRRSPASNLFVIQTCLLELALSARLEKSEICLDALTALILALDPAGTNDAVLPTEVHAAFVLVGTAVALELAGELLDADVASAGHEAVGRLAQRLSEGAERDSWAERTVNRAAWNHSIVAFAGLGVAGLALPDHPRAQDWIALAVEWSLLFFEHGITEAGMTREGLGYCGFVFRNLSPFLLGARARSVFDYRDSRQNPFIERLARIPSWYAGEVFPQGGWVQNLNDSYWEPHQALGGFLPAFLALDADLTTRFWQRTVGARGRRSYGADPSLRWSTLFESALWGPPDTAHGGEDVAEVFHCEDVGYLRQWTPDGRSGFSFNCGRYVGSIHDQSDNNSFTLFAEGVPIVIDAGAANRAEEGSPSSSYGHSAVIIDGLGQAPTGGGLGVSGRMEHVAHERGRTILAGDALDSYVQRGYNPVRRARRWCVFDHEWTPFLLVFDDIQKDDHSHTYEFLFHTPTPTDFLIDGPSVQLSIELQGVSAVAEIAVLRPNEVTISHELFVSPAQPPFEQHTLWRIATDAVCPEFVVMFIEGAEAVLHHDASAAVHDGHLRVMVELEGHPSRPIVLPRLGG